MRRTLLLVGVAVAAWCALAAPARATYGARVTADEPQYLLTAVSLAEDLDLDIADERREGRYRDFHEAGLPVQEVELDGGRRLSPHDPLLPVLLAGPVAVGGWLGAKLALAAMAGALAALTAWVAIRRFGVSQPTAVATVLAFGLAAPLALYGAQVYPELPAALAVTVAVAALTGSGSRRDVAVLGLAVTALPWLSVKYAPVAAVLAALGIVGLWRRRDLGAAVTFVAGLALAGLAYALVHRLVYGGWTVYAAGDHFTGGEHTVMGSDPDYADRSVRLAGLLVDRGFGLAAWQPAFLLAVPALAALVRRRPAHWQVLALPLVAGWLVATFVALTMHGWWWPGRQVVVVLPLVVLAVARWADGLPRLRPVLWVAAALGASVVGWLVVEALLHRLTLVVDFESTTHPFVRAWRLVLPDYRQPGLRTWSLHAVWLAGLAALAVAGWRTAARCAPGRARNDIPSRAPRPLVTTSPQGEP